MFFDPGKEEGKNKNADLQPVAERSTRLGIGIRRGCGFLLSRSALTPPRPYCHFAFAGINGRRTLTEPRAACKRSWELKTGTCLWRFN